MQALSKQQAENKVMSLISVCPFLPAFSFLILHSFKHSLFTAEAGDLFNTESC